MTEPITPEWQQQQLTDLRRMQAEVDESPRWPRAYVDVDTLVKSGVPFYFDPSGTIMFSGAGMAEAVATGAVWWVDEKGSRVSPPGCRVDLILPNK